MNVRKTWRERLAGFKDLPKVKPIPEPMRAKHGEGSIVIPSPQEVDALMRQVPEGRLVTVFQIGEALACVHGANIGCTVSTAIFASMAAQAAHEDELAGESVVTPYWRTLKANGELNPKYPGGIAALMGRLEAEGHVVVQEGKRFLVEDYGKKLVKP